MEVVCAFVGGVSVAGWRVRRAESGWDVGLECSIFGFFSDLTYETGGLVRLT